MNTSTPRMNTSALWDYFRKDTSHDRKAWCATCGELLSYKSSTGNLKTHLKSRHPEIHAEVSSLQRHAKKRKLSISPYCEGFVWKYCKKTSEIDKVATCFCGKTLSYRSTTGNLMIHLKRRHKEIFGNGAEDFAQKLEALSPEEYMEDAALTEEIDLPQKCEPPDSANDPIVLGPIDLWDCFAKEDIKGDDKKAKCNFCNTVYSYKTTTGNLKSHLRKKHLPVYLKLLKRGEDVEESIDEDETVGIVEAKQVILPPKKDPVEHALPKTKPKSSSLQEKIDNDLMDLFIDSYQPFSLVEERAFQKFCRWIPGYELPTCKKITQKLLPELYEKTKRMVDEEMSQNDLKKICLTTDLWTSRTDESYLSVTGHYINENFELKSLLIKCIHLENSLTSENIQTALIDMVHEWNISDKVNFITSNNVIMLEALKDLDWNHYGCYANTLNVIVQGSLTIVREDLDELKKVVRYFKTNAEAVEKLYEAQTKGETVFKRLVEEVPTRWNTSYYMLARCIELEEHLRTALGMLNTNLPIISEEQWQLFADLTKILKPFDDVARYMSGERYMSGSLVIVMTRCLVTSCEKLFQENFSTVAQCVVGSLKTSLEISFANVEKYATFSLCTFLDPRYKKSVFLDQNNAEVAKKEVQDQLVEMITEENENVKEVDSSKNEAEDKFSPWAILKDIVGANQTVVTPISKAAKEISIYLSEDNLPVFAEDGAFNCPFEWWRRNHYKFPNLARLFRNYGNIMASSVPCEQVFSKTGLIISDRRSRLTTAKLCQLAFLNGNLNQNRFNPT